MLIQINTDKNIDGGEPLASELSQTIEQSLDRFADRITRVEVHLSDENSDKQGSNDKRCLLEARLKGMEPVVVSHQAETLEFAINGATDKMRSALDTRVGKERNY